MERTTSHRGSARAAGLLRRVRAERAAIRENRLALSAFTVVLPESYDGDQNVSADDVLAGKVKFARLAVDGKVVAKATVASLFAALHERITESNSVISDVSRKLAKLGMRG